MKKILLDQILQYELKDKERYHLLRHFTVVPKKYFLNLAEKLLLSTKELDNQLNIKGSKFYTDFAENPDQLWKKIKEILINNLKIKVEKRNSDIYHIYYTYSFEEKPLGIGTNGIIKILDIPESTRDSIKTMYRGGFTSFGIKSIVLESIPSTWDIHIILRKSYSGISILTIFPGTYAPPFPTPKDHSPLEIKKYTRFWKTHAFIE